MNFIVEKENFLRIYLLNFSFLSKTHRLWVDFVSHSTAEKKRQTNKKHYSWKQYVGNDNMRL